MKEYNLLKYYRKSVNPPYKEKDLLILLATAFILILVPLTALAIITNRGTNSNAAGTATITLSPSTLTVNHNTNFTVEIRENSGTESINAVEADLTYDQNAVDFISINTSTSAFSVTFIESGKDGLVRIARSNPTPLTGNNVVARVTFKAKNTPTTTGIDFGPETALVRVSDQMDVLGTMTGGTYTIVDPPPTVNITSPVNNQIVSKTITVSATATDDLAVTKVEFLIGTQIMGTDTTASAGNVYSISLNTTTLTSGVKTLTAKAYDANSLPTNAPTSVITITIDNQAPTPPTLTGSPISVSQIDLSWSGSTDNIGVTDYDVYRNVLKITTVASTSYSNTGLTEGTMYSYYVIAKDGQGNQSTQSNTINVTTSRQGDLNGDGKVNIFDASIMTSVWDTADTAADLNHDGKVNIFDASILTANWTG